MITLGDTIKALKHLNKEVALDIGEHYYCALESNCPVAIKLRQFISEMEDVNLLSILEAGEAAEESFSNSVSVPSSITTNTIVSIAGNQIELDLGDLVEESVRDAVKNKLKEIENQMSRLHKYGSGLESAFNRELRRLRTSSILPQVNIPVSDLCKYKAYITEDKGNYAFIFPERYNPLYIYDNGINYQLCERDMISIMRDIHIKLTVNPEGKLFGMTILDAVGNKFQHYHGTGHDCWGIVKVPTELGNRINLEGMDRIRRLLIGALATINYNSLLNRNPPGFPGAGELLSRAIKMGREGEMNEPITAHVVQGEAPGWRTGNRTGDVAGTRTVNEDGTDGTVGIRAGTAGGWGRRNE